VTGLTAAERRWRSGLARTAYRGVALSAVSLVLASCGTFGLRDGGTEALGPATVEAPVLSELPADADLVAESVIPGGSTVILAAEVEGLDPILTSSVSFHPTLGAAADRWLASWTGTSAATFQEYLRRMGSYETLVDGELEERGLPASLRFLPIVESGYSPGAVSRAGATGLWQLTGPTAEGLGLTVNRVVDDRHDPVASTSAALEYLSALHDEFDSWFLALAAYNGGPGRVRRLLERYGADGQTPDEEFLAIHPHLPAETRDFVPRLLAAATLAGQPESFGFTASDPQPLTFDEVKVPDATSLDVVARAAGVDEERIRLLNPQYVSGFTPFGEPRAVRIPDGLRKQFSLNYAAIPPDERLSFVEHVVAAGETFSHIAERYGIRVADLADANYRLDPRRLQIGATVVVPLAAY
jgi:membrane-bound lytic murein transglycosylase D